ncbi:hypothetical protein PG995_008418 [Apiospora arundinis]|uniref:F-box domain-containing protein n=1 Tax=Apiospora arundinis TaxID=335852 RepID=A0ABR2I099_9PEZI
MSAGSPWRRQDVAHSCCTCCAGSTCRRRQCSIVFDTSKLLRWCPLPAELPPSTTRKANPGARKIGTMKTPGKRKPGNVTATGRSTSPQGLLGILPPELLQHILDELFVDGCATQFFSGRIANKPVQIVQLMVPLPQDKKGDEDTSPGIHSTATTTPGAPGLSLARTNRYWQKYVYGRLYGRNAFIFNMGISTQEVRHRSLDFREWQSWARSLPSEEGPGPLGPLSGRAARWLRDVTLVIACPTSQSRQELARLEAEVRRAVEILRECELPDSLQLCLQVCERVDKRYDTLGVDVLEASVVAEAEEGSGGEGGGKRRMKIEIGDPVVQEPTRMNKLQKAFEPLLELKGMAQKVVINGLLTREFYDHLHRAISIDGDCGPGPETLFSADGERVATGANIRHS